MYCSLPSGEFTVEIRKNIIFITSSGSFNEEGTKRMLTEMINAVRRFKSRPFGIFLDLTKLSGHTPGGLALLEEHNKWLNTQKFAARAVLLNRPDQHVAFKKHIPSVQSHNEHEFTDKENALAWLRSELD